MGTENYYWKQFPRDKPKSSIDRKIYDWLNYADQRFSPQSFKMFITLWAN